MITLGILAHVDAGKTTLSEQILYNCGTIKSAGRVDNGDTVLDSDVLEKQRGITIYASRACFCVTDSEGYEKKFTILDTPGHADFSAEMERTMSVLDYAVLVVSGPEGVQGHTHTLWKLLDRYEIPVFIFVNKMDRCEKSEEEIIRDLHKLGANVYKPDDFENIAMCSEELMEEYLASDILSEESIKTAIAMRRFSPVYFGSALKNEGVDEFAKAFAKLTLKPSEIYDKIAATDKTGKGTGKIAADDFSARVFKITHDEKHNRLTHMKVLCGVLKIRDKIGEEKVNGIRVYNGSSFAEVQEAQAGDIITVPGLTETYPGQGIGTDDAPEPMISPVMTYKLIYPADISPAVMMQNLKELEEESPEFAFEWDEKLKEIHVRVMGIIQLEILKSEIKSRYDVDVDFGAGSIVYKETVDDAVIGVGHFEPLRHYAEVHLRIEPAERGNGVTAASEVSTDMLALNWQRLVMTHILERKHRGVLTGSELTDVKITIVAGKAHLKHTEGGDFRQATYRAIRQGLMEAVNVLLEPYYDFTIKLPSNLIGRAMTDIDAMSGKCELPVTVGDDVVLEGYAPVSEMWNYANDLNAYAHGMGSITLSYHGYERCHNAEDVILAREYDPDSDVHNPSSSVFCSHGSGDIVPWNEVKSCAHIDLGYNRPAMEDKAREARRSAGRSEELWISPDEVDAILKQAGGANRSASNAKWNYHRHDASSSSSSSRNGRIRNVSRGTLDEDASAKTSLGMSDTAAQQDINSTSTSDTPSKTFRQRPFCEGYSEEDVRKNKTAQLRPRYLLIDGYNIIFAWDELRELAKENIDSARLKLNDIISNYAGFKEIETAVIYDAYRLENHRTEQSDYHNIHVVFTATAETADHYIERFTNDNAKKYDIIVATSDGLEQIIIQSKGCTLLSARNLHDEVAAVNQSISEIIHRGSV